MNEIIYHITEKEYFDKQSEAGQYFSPSFSEENFIHLSTENQIENTLKKYYHSKTGLVLLHIETNKILAELIYESATNGEFFPHIYGPINLNAISKIEPIHS